MKTTTLFTLLTLFGTANALISNFELDGNAVSDNPSLRDWATVSSGNGFVFTGILDDPAPLSTFTTGGSKDTNDVSKWRHKDSAVPDKDDLTHAYAYGEQYGDNLYVYFGTDRFANDGDAAIGFWFFQDDVHLLNNGQFTGNHKDGDVLVISNYGSTQEIQVYRWQAGALVLEVADNSAECDSSKNQTVCAITNLVPTPSPWSYTAKTGEVDEFPHHSFLEGGLNLRDIFEGDTVPCFTSFLVVSRSSSSTTAQLKDFVLGQFDICDLSVGVNCTDVSLNQARTGLTYDYEITVTNTGFGTLYNVELYYDNQLVANYPQLESGDVRQYFGTFSSTNMNESANSASVVGDKVQSPNSPSDYIQHTANPAQCPVITLNPGLDVNGTCSVGLVTENNRLSVKVGYGGQVCNTGDVQMENVVVSNARTTDTVDLGTLDYQGCKPYTGNFYPTTEAGYNNTVWVSGTSTLGSYSASDSTSMNCVLC